MNHGFRRFVRTKRGEICAPLKVYITITLVDIGGYMVDVLTLRDFKVDRGSCRSLRMGTITLFNAIRGELQRENISRMR